MVAEVHTEVQEDFYHGETLLQDAQVPTMDYHEMGLQPLEVEEGMVVEFYLYLHIYGEKVARLLVELQPKHTWQPLQQSQVGVAQLDLQVHVNSVEEAAMVVVVHTGMQEDVYHGEALLQDAQEPKWIIMRCLRRVYNRWFS
ncbi:hypothetical protein BU17DRAFT_65321 [Hysterangium stoloniferum]|nr:hypothetical protein BU17DRAFT_65321 [Hysterangium stoloniferum]